MGFLDQIQQANIGGGPSYGSGNQPGLGWSRNRNLDNDLIRELKSSIMMKRLMQSQSLRNNRGDSGENDLLKPGPLEPRGEYARNNLLNQTNPTNRSNNQGPMNVVFQPSPEEQNRIPLHREIQNKNLSSDKEKFELQEVKNQIAQQNANTNALKNQQIYDIKQKELEQKIAQSDANLKLAYDRLQQNAQDAEARRTLQEATIQSTNARHELTLAQRTREMELNKERLEEQIRRNDALNARLTELSKPEISETVIDPTGTRRTTTTRRGEVSNTPEITRPVPGNPNWIGYSTDGGKTWKARRATR